MNLKYMMQAGRFVSVAILKIYKVNVPEPTLQIAFYINDPNQLVRINPEFFFGGKA